MLRLFPDYDDLPPPPDRVKSPRDRLTRLAHKLILDKQRQWALNKGLTLQGSKGDRGQPMYTQTLEENLFQPLSPETRRDFERGDGNELSGKILALHSSAALAVNCFDVWRSLGALDPPLRALGLPPGASSLCFECKLQITTKFSRGPNLDLAFTYPSGGFAVLLEAKYTESFGREHRGFPSKYLHIPHIWDGLDSLYRLACQLCGDHDPSYAYLDAPQLIKHVLGGCQAYGKYFTLYYLFYDVLGEPGVVHREEIECFSRYLERDGIDFRYTSYQEYLLRLAVQEYQHHPAYVQNLIDRYL